MRLIPGKTKVKIELFKKVTLADVIVGLVGLGMVTLCVISSLPGRWIIATFMLAIFAVMLFRIDEEPTYIFAWRMLRYRAYPRRYARVLDDKLISKQGKSEASELIFGDEESDDYGEEAQYDGYESYDNSNESYEFEAERNYESESYEGSDNGYEEQSEEDYESDGTDTYAGDERTAAQKRAEELILDKSALKKVIKQENKILKSKTATEEEKNAVWQARADRTAAKKKLKAKENDGTASYEDMSEIMPFTGVKDGFIEYGGKYFGSVIEIDPVEFRFFSQHRRNNSIENCFGKILRGLHGDYGANIVKLQRPIVYDRYLDAEYDKLDALKKSYESGLISEDELKARVEIQYDRINEVRGLCGDNKVIEPFYYLVLFETDKGRLDIVTRQAMADLEQGELVVRRLDDRGLILFLKYSNSVDFDEKEIDNIDKKHWVDWAMPEKLKFSMRKIVVNKMITHNLRVVNYPTTVGDSWLAGVMSYPSTKVVVKITPMDKGKSIRAIDRSLAELRGQYMTTGTDSKMIELREHIDTLSELLLTMQQDNEMLLSVNIYITAYDASLTAKDPILAENFKTVAPYVSDMKKSLRRSWSESGMRLSGMDFMQLQSFIGSQVSAYDPMIKDARGIPSNTIAGMFPWIFAHISDVGGIKLGSSDGVPVFIDFFRRDTERVNSNMVIVGKSGSGKSYATKSLLTNLASEDAKIFILDPENEYAELAHNLQGKVINVGNAKYGRLNPFHIITALDDDEAGEEGGGPGGSYATHLQFLEEFFRQILPDIDRDALEYLNSLVERVYLNFGITPDTDLSKLTAYDYPIFDDLYDVILVEFERTNNEYLRSLLRSLINYISKFSTGGRNANIWNGPSTITTDENFSVFNFQSMLANRNTLIANAQMLLVLKYIDNEIIKNRDYNLKYGINRKIVVVIDEAHVFIDTKFPVALDFMFQLAKRIRKYNGMQIVITQNIKDFVGSEEIARKSTAIINACQYSFVFGLAPNDMNDLCKLYEKAGGINEQEQEDIIGAKRGQAFTILSPTSRSSFKVEVPDDMVDVFENKDHVNGYFDGVGGYDNWESFVAGSRDMHDQNLDERKRIESIQSEKTAREDVHEAFTFTEISESEAEALNNSNQTSQQKEESYGGINFSETSEEDYGSINFSETAEEDYGSINFSEASEEDYGSINFSETSEEDLDETGFSETDKEDFDESEFSEISDEDLDETEFSESFEEDFEEAKFNETARENHARSAGYGRFDGYSGEIPAEFKRYETAESEGMGYTARYAQEKSHKPEKIRARERFYEPERTYAEERVYDNHSTYNQERVQEPVNNAVSQSYIDEALNKFKNDLREEMERELADKLRWITLGAQAAQAQFTQVQPQVMQSQAIQPQAMQQQVQPVQASAQDIPQIDTSFMGGTDDDSQFKGFESESYDESENYDSYDETEEYDELDAFLDEESDFGSEELSDGTEDEDFDFDDSDETEDEDFDFDDSDETEDDDYDFDDSDDDSDDSDEDSDDFDFDDDDSDDDFEFDDFDDLYSDDDSEEYEPAPFLFAELLAEAAEEYADMTIEERMEDSGEEVMEITLEELAEYIKQQRKKAKAANTAGNN